MNNSRWLAGQSFVATGQVRRGEARYVFALYSNAVCQLMNSYTGHIRMGLGYILDGKQIISIGLVVIKLSICKKIALRVHTALCQ